MHTEGDTTGTVKQVPRDRLMRKTAKGMLLICCNFAQIQMHEIMCLRLVAARFQEIELDDKSITWGDTGECAWGQNVLTGAAAERRDIALAEELAIIHPQAFLQPERAIDLNPDNKAATASVFMKLHNNMQRAPKKGGFLLLNHNVHPMLLEDAAFHKFKEMSNIGPWIDRQGKLQWDYVTAAGFKGARNVRSGDLGSAARKATLIESEGYMVNDKGVMCCTGYHNLGNLRKDALVESDGHMVNDKGVVCSTGYHKLGNLSGVAQAKTLAVTALGEHHTHVCISALCQRGASVKWENGCAILVHHCYDPQQSGVAGQPPRQKKGLKLHVCKKCHRTAKDCKGGAACRAPACSNTSLKSCQHLH